MTKTIRGCLSAAMLAAMLVAAPGLARAVTISLSGTGGPTLSVTIAVSGIEALTQPSLGGFDLDLGFDPTVLAFGDVAFGSFLGGATGDSIQDVQLLGGNVVDFAEVSLIFPTSDLEALQPDAFALATVTFFSLVEADTLTQLTLSQALLSDGAGGRIAVSLPAALELQATGGVIPEVAGVHVFALGVLLALAGRSLLRPAA